MSEREHLDAGGMSGFEVEVEDVIATIDPKRAHAAIGDTEYTVRVQLCGTCQAKVLSRQASQASFPEVGEAWPDEQSGPPGG